MKKNILIFLLLSTCIFADGKKVSIYPMPIISFAPETSWRVGVTTRFIFDIYQDSLTRKSNAKFSLSYTGLEQIILENDWNYFFKGENWRTRGKAYFSKFREFYYGMGETSINDEISFDFTRSEIRAGLFYKLRDNLFTGPFYKYLAYYDLEQVEGEVNYQELLGSHVNAAGWSVIYDNRKNLLNPIQGKFAELTYFYNINSLPDIQKFYHRLNLDLRYYFSFAEKFTLATRSINFFNIGDAPFYDQAQIGGEEVARGYLLGRHRSNNMMSLQSEFRFPFPGIKLDLPFFGEYEAIYGIGFFGGISRVFDDFGDFAKSTIFPNYGISLKWMIDKSERVNIRFDYGIGTRGESGFYIKFGESF